MPTVSELAEQKLSKPMRLRVRRELRKADGVVGADQVVNVALAERSGNGGIVIVTDRRLIFLEAGMTKTRQEEWPYQRVSSVETATGMMHGELTIRGAHGTGDTKLSKIVPKDAAREIGSYVLERVHQAPGPG